MPFFVENPADQYGNRAYTASQPQVVEADVTTDEFGREILHFVTPGMKEKWPSVIRNGYGGWNEVAGPARTLTREEWRAMSQSDRR